MNVTGAGSARPWPRDVLLGGILVGVFVLAALLAPWLAPCDPAAQRLEQRLEGPSAAHPLGLDELGRDILSRLLHGARVSLLVGLAVVALAGLFGGAAGALAGWAGGAVDAALMRLADVVLAFPGILLAIALVGVLGPALRHLVLALVAIGWVGYARLLRAQVLAWREREFVLAGRALGLPGWRLLVRHLLPNVLPPFLVQLSLGMAGAILAEASLSFLGLGIQPPTPSWGAMINAGRGHLLDAPHLTLVPGLAILMVVLGLSFLGDGLVELLDPERRS
ncbi:MAG: ABC transporter permease [Acidobacteria bacterium]|jgi:peptide/nickel transport system permease protein|nr:ABC transporter permease [Thermoanaerobaculia bacterium]MDI9631995.1 ABC transporter permease [Acidobacteriota bacterium]OQC35515.1 MAG: putative D,D-dipeptide transport system permease protein DdpC [Acidobacteria bacterium ADurb.Bin051]MBP7813178.1 ABC transporter permease [Thermoanaerobaculia bacterium]MBP8845471.1 ABC transporter permease [Thermoanaerobaculia bacterium]